MPTSAPDQVPAHSYDDGAVSISVSNRSATDPRPGAFFDGDFSAVSPVHFHNLGGGKYLGIFSHRWYGASHSSSDPNLFSSYEVDSSPSWIIFDGKNGHHVSIPSHGGVGVTTNVPSDTRFVTGACSRSSNYLYVLQSCSLGGVSFGVMSHYHINNVTDNVNLLAEEVMAGVAVDGETVVFDRGLWCSTTHLNLVGRGSVSGNMFLARKHWGRIGQPTQREYQSARGWFTGSSRAVPLHDFNGAVLTTAGPVSVTEYQGKTWMSVVRDDSGDKSAQVYSSAGLWDGWAPQGQPYPLGNASTYLGGTAYFQPSLRPNRSMVGQTSLSGVPIVSSVKAVSGGDEGISINWDLWPIPIANGSRVVSSEASLGVSSSPSASGS